MVEFARHASAMLQGTEEFSDVLNTPDIVTTPLTGLPSAYTHIFQFVGGSSVEGLTFARDSENGTPPTADHVINSFYIRFSDISPTTEYAFFALAAANTVDITGDLKFSLVLETDGDIRVRDAAEATIATITDPLTVDTWHRFEIRHFPNAGSSAEVQIWLDGSEILSNQTGETTASHNNTDFVVMAGSPTGGETVFFAGGFAQINSSSASDRLDSDFEIVGPYSIGQASTATPDDDGGGTDGGGDDLDGNGTDWATTAEIPFSDETKDTDAAEYDGDDVDGSCYCDGGTRGGPNLDSNVDGDSNIKNAQYTFRCERGNGGGDPGYTLYFGNNVDAGGSPGLWAPGTALFNSPVNFTVSSEHADVMPLSGQTARMGGGTASEPRSLYFHEMACTLLHVPGAAATALNLIMAPYVPAQRGR